MFRKATSLVLAIILFFTMTGGGLELAQTAHAENVHQKEVIVLYKPSKSLRTFNANKAEQIANLNDDVEVLDTWKFKETKQSKSAQKSKKSKNNKGTISGDINVALVKSPSMSAFDLAKELEKNPAVEMAEVNQTFHASTINDSYYKYQWGLKNTGQNGGTKGVSTNVSAKWDNGETGSNNVIAVVDTGVDYTHPDLANSMWKNNHFPDLKGRFGFDFSNHDDDPIDDNGHGTHCAGIIGAQGNNGLGISGVNQKSKIMALKFLSDSGDGDTVGAIGAYNYIDRALDLGVNITAINNSWGGGGYSHILNTIVTRVGEKGAVSVFAAGNESVNLDEDIYGTCVIDPSNLYCISVAATNEDGELANFSNYGKVGSHIGAPGTDILSTVSYDCYNPTLYSKEKQNQVSAHFNDFENVTDTTGQTTTENNFGIPKAETMQSSLPNSKVRYNASITDTEYFGKESYGKSLKITLDNVSAGELITFKVPCDTHFGTHIATASRLSIMAKAENHNQSSDYSILAVFNLPKGKDSLNPSDFQNLIEANIGGRAPIDSYANCWSHISTNLYDKYNDKERELVFAIAADTPGTYDIYLDNFGISKNGIDPSQFEKYDFYNGTSMATPFVTGAIALNDSAVQQAEGVDENTPIDGSIKINNLLSKLKNEPKIQNVTKYGGTLDFTQKMDIGPSIKNITTDFKNNTIIINGFGLAIKNLTVKINNIDAEIIDQNDRQMIIRDNGWLNNLVDIQLITPTKIIEKRDVYLIQTKTPYSTNVNFNFPMESEVFASDGRNLYIANSDISKITKIDTVSGDEIFLGHIDMDSLFENIKSNDTENIQTEFSKDLVYMDGYLYTVAKAYASSNLDDMSNNNASYASSYKLLKISSTKGTYKDLGTLPKDLLQIEDYSLSAYNGKLYILGGYDFEKQTVSNQVKIYDPAKNTWSNGPKMPDGRAMGKALQVGNKLIYTFGYSESTKVNEQNQGDSSKISAPKNMILSGENWSISKSPISFIQYYQINKSGNIYSYFTGNVGIYKYGLVYAGTPAYGLGDTFSYNINHDRYKALSCQIIKDLNTDFFIGTTFDNHFYGVNGNGETCGFKILSGLVSIQAKNTSGGKIQGANKPVLPGTKLTVKPVANKGYFVKAFTVSGKSTSLKGQTLRLVSDKNASASFGRAVSYIKLNKTKLNLRAGKTYKLKAYAGPKSATYRQVTFKSNNPRYVKVSQDGTLTAYRRGIGKTVKITVSAKYKSNAYKNCYVKVIK